MLNLNWPPAGGDSFVYRILINMVPVLLWSTLARLQSHYIERWWLFYVHVWNMTWIPYQVSIN